MRVGLQERVEFTSYAMRARIAAYGAGSVREYRMKDGGLVIESFIPGTKLTAAVAERPDGRLRGVIHDRDRASSRELAQGRYDLASDFDLSLFMHEWDVSMMRSGLRGFYPACLLEFVDRLMFDERDASVGSLAPGVLARRALAFPWKPFWRASDELAAVVDQYCEDFSAGSATRRAAEAMRRYLASEEDVPFDLEGSRTRWIGQVMRMVLSSGREVASPLGLWREAMGKDTVRSAIWLMCRDLPRASLARRSLGEHLATWSRAYAIGGCDHYILMNGEEPVAVATVSVDGRVNSVTKPGLFPGAVGNPITSAEERLLAATR